jgi:hypothetical protein
MSVDKQNVRFAAWPIADGRSDRLRANWGSIGREWAGICGWQNRPFFPGAEEGAAAKPAIPITGKQAGEDESKPVISIAGITAGRRNYCEPMAEEIAAKIEVGLSPQNIYLAGSRGAKRFQQFLPLGTTFCSRA